MKKVISFLIFAIAIALLISCRSTRKCYTLNDQNINPTLTEATLYQTEVA